jgi:hypothetical protein
MHGNKTVRDVAMRYWKVSVVMLVNRLCKRDVVMDVSRVACSDRADIVVLQCGPLEPAFA